MNVAKICYWTSESVDEIVAVINRSLFPKFDCEINLEKLKDRIVYTLVNADSNKSRLKTIPCSYFIYRRLSMLLVMDEDYFTGVRTQWVYLFFINF